MKPSNLQFIQGEAGSYTFDTGVLKGILRHEGKSNGLFPVTYNADSSEITLGAGLFNHYRVFTRGKRYGYGARRWDSTAELNPNGNVEVIWSATTERPFELEATYSWVAPNTVDLVTIVRATTDLQAFEVFLASYYCPPFIDSQVWASRDPRGGDKEGFVSADQELGVWLAFPRDEGAAAVIDDGRWNLEPHPLAWTMMPNFALPLAIRRNPNSGLTVITIAESKECFGIFTPYGEEKHYSNYMSFFGHDFETGEIAKARSRLVVLPDPTEMEILKVANDLMNDSSYKNK